MVYNKSAFWKALVITVIVFGIGILIGVYLESYRTNLVEQKLMNSEMSLLDEQLRTKAFVDFNVSCSQQIESTFSFADRIYNEASQLEQYDAAAKFSDSLTLLHGRYDLLRMMLWSESVQIKAKCGPKFHTVVYFYDYNTQDVQQRAEQTSVARVLMDLKAGHPYEVLLIPMAGNLGLDSVKVATDKYKVKTFPGVVIDENKTLEGLTSVKEIEKIIF